MIINQKLQSLDSKVTQNIQMLRIFQGRLFESNLLHTKISKQVLITQLLFSHTAFRRNEKILHSVLFDSKPGLNGLVPFSKGLRDGCIQED